MTIKTVAPLRPRPPHAAHQRGRTGRPHVGLAAGPDHQRRAPCPTTGSESDEWRAGWERRRADPHRLGLRGPHGGVLRRGSPAQLPRVRRARPGLPAVPGVRGAVAGAAPAGEHPRGRARAGQRGRRRRRCAHVQPGAAPCSTSALEIPRRRRDAGPAAAAWRDASTRHTPAVPADRPHAGTTPWAGYRPSPPTRWGWSTAEARSSRRRRCTCGPAWRRWRDDHRLAARSRRHPQRPGAAGTTSPSTPARVRPRRRPAARALAVARPGRGSCWSGSTTRRGATTPPSSSTTPGASYPGPRTTSSSRSLDRGLPRRTRVPSTTTDLTFVCGCGEFLAPATPHRRTSWMRCCRVELGETDPDLAGRSRPRSCRPGPRKTLLLVTGGGRSPTPPAWPRWQRGLHDGVPGRSSSTRPTPRANSMIGGGRRPPQAHRQPAAGPAAPAGRLRRGAAMKRRPGR